MNFRKKIIMSVMLLSILLIPTYRALADDEEDAVAEKKIILIDPGHGGYDGGAEGKTGIKEKDINLSISLKLKNMLKTEGFQVFMTREKDEALIDQRISNYSTKKSQDLANRCKIKKDVNPDLFISIHQNHFPQGQYYGSQVWYSDYKESNTLAHLIQGNLIMDLDKNNKRVEKPAKNNYKILRNNDTMPSVLVECGFLSNYNEELRLKNEEYQALIAKSLTRSIKAYLDEN